MHEWGVFSNFAKYSKTANYGKIKNTVFRVGPSFEGVKLLTIILPHFEIIVS